MNVLFHLATGVAIIAIHSRVKQPNKPLYYISGFVLGVISHGILDYTPHCYPIHSKVDAILGLITIVFLLFTIRKEFKILSGFILLGSIFPDLLDLSPGIINNLFQLNLPTFNPIFPWHFHHYSGSIYSNNCSVSTLNHFLVLLFCGIIVFLNFSGVKRLFNSKNT